MIFGVTFILFRDTHPVRYCYLGNTDQAPTSKNSKTYLVNSKSSPSVPCNTPLNNQFIFQFDLTEQHKEIIKTNVEALQVFIDIHSI